MSSGSNSTPDRIAILRQFIATSPADPFPRYGLALELKNAGKLAESAAEFTALIAGFPAYVASYLMAGNTHVELGQLDEARAVYAKGIEVATQKGDGHARSELEAALAQIAG